MLIKNLLSLLSEDNLQKNYYICDSTKAKRLFLFGFQPISVDQEQYYAFYKTELLMDFLNKEANENV